MLQTPTHTGPFVILVSGTDLPDKSRFFRDGAGKVFQCVGHFLAKRVAVGEVELNQFAFPSLSFPGIERRQDERCASALSADRTDATFPLEVGDSRNQCIICRIDTVQDGQLAHIEARMQMQCAQYCLVRNESSDHIHHPRGIAFSVNEGPE